MFDYNDNELLYLIKEGDEVALDILLNKYDPLIWKRVNNLNVRASYRDDYHQIGLEMLFRAIKIYDSHYEKTFNKYFDLILQRRLWEVFRKNKKYYSNIMLVGAYDYLESMANKGISGITSKCDSEYDERYLNDFERIVFQYYKDGHKPSQISKILDTDIKKIYNTIYSIRRKIQ